MHKANNEVVSVAVPKYNEFFSPVLRALEDGQIKRALEIRKYALNYLNVSEEDRKQMLPSNTQWLVDNRATWAITYLCKADAQTASMEQINKELSANLLSEIMERSPAFFEKMVVQLLLKMGYGSALEDGFVTGCSGDEGIDGIIREDKLGFSSIYIQAKRWAEDKAIGRPEIQKFVGALAGQGAQKGLFITTGTFTKEARSYVEKQLSTKVVLVDGEKLTKLMIEYNLGVSVETVYTIKKIDTDFFSEEND